MEAGEWDDAFTGFFMFYNEILLLPRMECDYRDLRLI